MRRTSSGTPPDARAVGALLVAALAIAVGALACGEGPGPTIEDAFRRCVSAEGEVYEDASSALLAWPEAEVFLRGVAARRGLGTVEGMTAEILLARLARPGVFERYRALRTEPRDRAGRLAEEARAFLALGPEDRSVTVATGSRLTERGWKTVYKEIEKHTEVEVAEGKARNRAARLALLEHFLRFLHGTPASERVGIIRLAEQTWISGPRSRGEDDRIVSWKLLRAWADDATQPWIVRSAAATALARSNWPAARGALREAIASEGTDDRDACFAWFYDCCLALSQFGDREDEDWLRRLEPGADWKREVISGALDVMEAIRGE